MKKIIEILTCTNEVKQTKNPKATKIIDIIKYIKFVLVSIKWNLQATNLRVKM